ncbi:MAG: hypothetical protein Q7U86_06600 [Draconibacterium sp.]|nr:hypothetical protein [Draconibacterium sp.]
MKTKIWVLTTLALFIAAISFATDLPKMNVNANDASKLAVSFESTTASPVELMISDRDGVILYSWKSEMPEAKISKMYNLSELGDVTFNICLNYGGKSINWEVCIKGKNCTVGPAVQLNEPFFNYKNDHLNVSFLNVAQKSVYLNIYKNGEHYNGFTLGKDMDIQKCIDFSMAEKGSYEIVLTDYFKEHHYALNK